MILKISFDASDVIFVPIIVDVLNALPNILIVKTFTSIFYIVLSNIAIPKWCKCFIKKSSVSI